MSLSRRHLPPLSWLTAFEAVARLGSVTDAAHELDLTQSAVSRQIAKLEALTGRVLFERDRKRLRVTARGAAYAAEVRGALAQIQTATIALQTNPDGGALNLACLPSLGTHWLAPRLPGFLRQHPGISVNMSTRLAPFDFAEQNFHAAILHGQGGWLGRWSGVEALKLWDEHMIAVATPDLLAQDEMAHLPRLQIETRPDAWPSWFETQSLPAPGRPAMVVDQFGTMLRAAQAGLGVALVPDYLARPEALPDGLQIAKDTQPVAVGAYYLLWPEARADYPALVAFRDWLTEASAERFTL